ncbi:PP2 domain-containing protein [Cephalotus follicularis]|uniref:PP2 domain-containing protein n=1 Tax=Cephalotus follicularis TaxID=3775 RepID=A0A1Q3BWY4_CEPFO|nr:PP2 domain-containing protein [Cephalotus follicularis]
MHSTHVVYFCFTPFSLTFLSLLNFLKPNNQQLYFSLLKHEENYETFFDLPSHFPSQLSPHSLCQTPSFLRGLYIYFNLLISFLLFMGTGVSSIGGATSTGLDDIPESCVSCILMHLDPPEICKMAGLNKTFHGASSADFLWESKLPSNYNYVVKKVIKENPQSLRKKEIYSRLSHPNLFDNGTKEVWLDKISGKICLSISSKALRITGIDDRRYWNHITTEESRFQSVAYLQQMWWFEVVGEIEFEFPQGTYSLCFRLHLGKVSKRFGRRVCNLEQVHGWDIKPVRFQLSTSNGHNAMCECYLREPGNWVLYHVGDFVVENPNVTTKIKFSMIQIDCTHTKGGLCVDSVFIFPSNFRERSK